MAAIAYFPPPGTVGGTVEVRFDGMIFTFAPGIPVHVEPQDQAGVLAALRATQAAMTSPQPAVTPTGGAAGTYTYEVVAVNANGDTLPGTVRTITNGPTTLDGTHYNTITWTAPPGATSVKIVRTAGGATQGLIANPPVAQTTLVDNGLTATTYTAAGAAVSQAGAALVNTEI